jgi:hypothetical protein
MCLDKVWLAWGDAWMNKKPFKAEKIGIAYMLAGDTGASNIDPYAEKRTSDNQWIAEGPHIMVLFPDPAQLDALPTDPNQACGRRSVARSTGIAPPSITMTNVGWSKFTRGDWSQAMGRVRCGD